MNNKTYEMALVIARMSRAEEQAFASLVESIRTFEEEFREGWRGPSSNPSVYDAVQELIETEKLNGGTLPRGALKDVATKHDMPPTTLRDAYVRAKKSNDETNDDDETNEESEVKQ